MLRVLISALAIAILGCGSPPSDSSQISGPPRVMTSFYPMTYFCSRIAGAEIDLVCPILEEEDPIFWQPSLEAVQAYQSADLVILNGAGFEKWADTVSLPRNRLLRSAEGMTGDVIKYQGQTQHSHGAGGMHSHTGLDGHTWLDPQNAIEQSDMMRKALSKLLPNKAQVFDSGFEALKKDLMNLGERVASLSEQLNNKPLFMSHPAYNYIARRYHWNIYNLDLDPETMPSKEVMTGIAKKQQDHPAKILIWESAPLPGIVEQMEQELGLKSVVFSPCEQQESSDLDYLDTMRLNLDRLQKLLIEK